MATSRRVGNYAQSAKAVTQASDQIFDAAMSGKPDFTKISKEAIKGRSLERRAVTKAEADVASAGLEAFTKTNLTRMEEDTKKKVADIKRPAKRMAGVVAGLGAISGAAVSMKNNRDAKAERAELRALRSEIDSKQDARWAAQDERFETMMAEFRNGGSSNNNADSGVSNTGVTSNEPSNQAPSPSPTPTTSTPPVGGDFRGEVYNYLTSTKGLSRNKALGLMANIDRESSFRTNPQGGDGGNSFGMFQWNNTYGRSQRMKDNVKDWQTNWQGQIDHALSGNQLPEYNQVTNDFLNTTFETPQAAADYWMQHWERPAHQERDSKRHTEILSGYNY